MKKTTHVGVKMSDEDRARVVESARAAGVSISEFIRRRAVGDAAPARGAPPAAAAPASHHVDELGADALRVDNGALSR